MRSALLRAALALAAEHGFTSLGLREVSREAGIAPTSFYRHFADMHELGLALIEELAVPLLQGAAASAQGAWAVGDDGAALLIELLQRAARDDPQLLRFILSARHGAVRGFRERLREALAALAHAALVGPDLSLSPALTEAAAAVLMTCCEEQLDADAREAVGQALARIVAPGKGGHHA